MLELVNWRMNGMSAELAKATQEPAEDQKGRRTVQSTQRRRGLWDGIWDRCRSIRCWQAWRSLHATSCGPECNWSQFNAVYRSNMWATKCSATGCLM